MKLEPAAAGHGRPTFAGRQPARAARPVALLPGTVTIRRGTVTSCGVLSPSLSLTMPLSVSPLFSPSIPLFPQAVSPTLSTGRVTARPCARGVGRARASATRKLRCARRGAARRDGRARCMAGGGGAAGPRTVHGVPAAGGTRQARGPSGGRDPLPRPAVIAASGVSRRGHGAATGARAAWHAQGHSTQHGGAKCGAAGRRRRSGARRG